MRGWTRLAAIFKPKKIVQADVTYVDLPAPPASSEGHIGTEELPADHLARLRDSDALLHVVRAFEDPAVPHPEGSVDPARDLERLDLEFLMADLAMTDRRLERLAGQRPARDAGRTRGRRARGGRPAPAEDRAGCRHADPRPGPGRGRGEGHPRLPVPDPEAGHGPAQRRRRRPGGGARDGSRLIAAGYVHEHAVVDALSARIEMELGELEPDEAAVFMEELGIHGSGLDRIIALSYTLLGLISFLTAGPDEVRAWPIPDGSTAVDAAGAIHTDLAKGFIRAETVSYDDLVNARFDGRGAEGRPAALRGQDLQGPRRRRPGDPLQPLRLERLSGRRGSVAGSVRVRVEVGVDRLVRRPSAARVVVLLVVIIVVVLVAIGEVDLELGEEVLLLDVETLTEAIRRSSLTKMNPWSRSSSMAMASTRVSWWNWSWIRRRIFWTSSKNSSGSHSESLATRTSEKTSLSPSWSS